MRPHRPVTSRRRMRATMPPLMITRSPILGSNGGPISPALGQADDLGAGCGSAGIEQRAAHHGVAVVGDKRRIGALDHRDTRVMVSRDDARWGVVEQLSDDRG